MSRKFWIIVGAIALLLVGGGAMMGRFAKKDPAERYRQAAVERGRVTQVVNSTGTVKSVKSVDIAAFVSAPVTEVHVDFNDEVAKDQLLAKIDPRLYEANVARDEATLAVSKADLERVTALARNAKNNEQRAQSLRTAKKTFISDQEFDQFVADRRSLEAQVSLAEASIAQAQANLRTSRQNLEYTEIRSPVSGMVIDRKVEVGQTVVASFQTTTLFVVAPDLKQKIHVYAAVDEADIGLIRDAEEEGNVVNFSVDAYPETLFEGRIEQIRKSPTTSQNVVTYTVVVAASNPDLKLLPGMTTNISFEIRKRDDVLKIPNSALRYFPKPDLVREEDRPILEGDAIPSSVAKKLQIPGADDIVKLSAAETIAASQRRNKRHVWVLDGELLRAVPITVGIAEARFTEMTAGELKEGDLLVVGAKSTFGK